MKTNMYQVCTMSNVYTVVDNLYIISFSSKKNSRRHVCYRLDLKLCLPDFTKVMAFSIAIWQEMSWRFRVQREALWNFNFFSILHVTLFMFLGSSWH